MLNVNEDPARPFACDRLPQAQFQEPPPSLMDRVRAAGIDPFDKVIPTPAPALSIVDWHNANLRAGAQAALESSCQAFDAQKEIASLRAALAALHTELYQQVDKLRSEIAFAQRYAGERADTATRRMATLEAKLHRIGVALREDIGVHLQATSPLLQMPQARAGAQSNQWHGDY